MMNIQLLSIQLKMRVIFIIAAVTMITIKADLDNNGNLFMLSFIEPSYSPGSIYLAITAENSTTVKIIIPFLDEEYEQNLTEGQSMRLALSTDIRYSSWFTKKNQGVKVTSASAKVTVMVQDYGQYDTSGYMALPYRVLSDSYIAVIYHTEVADGLYPVFLILGVENDTIVTVFYNLKNGENCDGLSTGDDSSINLDEHDVYGIMCTGDFTGTFIQSNQPIAVISGHQKLTLYFGYPGKDAVQEMLLPIKHFGQSYVLFSHQAWGRGSVNKIVAAYDDTRVISSNGDTTDLQAYEYFTIDTETYGQLCITSNRPIQVVSFGKSFAHAAPIGDTFMSILLPTNTFSNKVHLKFPLTDLIGVGEYINLTIIVDRRTVPEGPVGSPVTHEVINGCHFDTYTQGLSWPFWVQNSSFRFGAYIYGTYGPKFSGFGLPAIMSFDSEGCILPCVNGNCTWNQTEYFCLCDEPYFGPQCIDQVIPPSTVPAFALSLPVTDGLYLDPSSPQTLLPAFHTSEHESKQTDVVDQASVSSLKKPNEDTSTWSLLPSSAVAITSSEVLRGGFENMQSSHDSEMQTQRTNEAASYATSAMSSIYPFLEASLETSMLSTSTPAVSHLDQLTVFKTPSQIVISNLDTSANIEISSQSVISNLELSPAMQTSSQSVISNLELSLAMQTSSLSVSSKWELSPAMQTSSLSDSSNWELSPVMQASSQSVISNLELSSAMQTTSQTEPLDLCGCFCFEQNTKDVDSERIRFIKLKIKKELLVERRNLSRTVRRRTSAKDDRPSAVSVGCSGILLLALVGAVILFPDIFDFLKNGAKGSFRYNRNLRRNRRL